MERLPRILAALLLLLVAGAAAADVFVAKDVRVRGLQRIPVERVYAVLPVKAGDSVDDKKVADTVRALYQTGDFQDVQVGRDGDTLVVSLSERPAISKIEIEGNKSIDTDQLLNGLKSQGLAEGEVFRRSTLDNMQVELQRQYIAQGRYGAKIEPEVTPQPRNRVSIKVKITEGKPARIGGIRFVGNQVFDDDTLHKVLKMKERHFWSFIQGDDKYAREALSGDLESLRSYYMDRGYIKFQVNATQVTVTPDRRQVFITVSLSEGDKYTVSEVQLAGELPLEEGQLKPLILVRPQQTFSQQVVTTSADILTRRLGIDGYIFADVKPVPEPDDAKKTVKLTFFVDPGDRVYVNRIGFTGNTKTRDEVLRREMRQFEGAPASLASIELGKRRLEQLGFFGSVKSDTPRVPGTTDQVDLDYTVEEQPSGSIGANVGYSQGQGLVFGANVSQNNFFGTGNRVAFAVNRSAVRDNVNLSYNNPYYTDDGVSRGWNAYYSATDFSKTNISGYTLDRSGANVTFGYPVSELTRLSFQVGIDRALVKSSNFVAEDYWQFIDRFGSIYDSYLASAAWTRSTLNRGVLADRGTYNRVGVDASLPGSDNEWYKLNYSGQAYLPLTKSWTLKGRTDLGWGNGYGQDSALPFYQRYTAGGFGSVRGWQDRSLGAVGPSHVFVANNKPDPSPDPIGGDVLVEAGLELIFPMPFVDDGRNVRPSIFYDAGNTYLIEQDIYPMSWSELRRSVGLSLSWYTMIGPLSFSIAKTLNNQPGDKRQAFQFSLGQPF